MALINNRTGLPAERRPEDVSRPTGEQSQRAQTTQPTAAERLHQMNETAKKDLENSLLKESLTEYSAKYEELSKLLLKALADIEKTNKEQTALLAQKLQSVRMINATLEKTLTSEVGELGADLRESLIAPIDDAIAEQQHNIDAHAEMVSQATNDTKEAINKLKTKTEQFWAMSNIQRILFWISVPCNIVLAAYIIIDLFIKSATP